MDVDRGTFSKHGRGNAGYVLDSQLNQIFRNHAVQDKVTLAAMQSIKFASHYTTSTLSEFS